MAEVDNNLRDLHDSSYHRKAESDSFFVILFKIFSKFFNIDPYLPTDILFFFSLSLSLSLSLSFYVDTPKIFLWLEYSRVINIY